MKIRVDGGYINYNPSTDNGEYCYYIQDHIGNNRVILSETRGVIQYADYYPYGIPFSEIPMEEDNFLHAGKGSCGRHERGAGERSSHRRRSSLPGLYDSGRPGPQAEPGKQDEDQDYFQYRSR